MAEGERAPALVDLPELAQTGADQGAVWARETEDLDVNVVAFPVGRGVGAHVNAQVDVLLLVVAGSGVAEIDGRPHRLSPGVMVIIPKGARRALRCTTDRLVYVTFHRRRPRLQPAVGSARR
jgi:quercetin dioxygenase-like cupin family protein